MSVDGDGNCMAHSISRAISGVEVFFHVLRTELLAELQSNVEFYRDRSIASGFYTEEDWVRDLESAGPSQMGQAGMWMSGMHIFGMANVLRRPIFLVDARQNAGTAEPDLMVVTHLVEMGFTQHAALRAAVACQNQLDECMQWVLDHEHDPLLNEPMDADSHHRTASASARGGLFLPLRLTPEECQVDGVMPSPLMIACANADASHFCSVVTVAQPEPTDDGMIRLDWTVPEGAEGGKPFSDTIEVNGELVGFTGMVPADAVPGDVLKISINYGPGGPPTPGGAGKIDKALAQKLKQNSGLQQRQLASAVHRIVEDGRTIVHALSMLLTGQKCEPEAEETEQLYADYKSGMGKDPISVVFVNTVPDNLTMAQILHDGSVAKTWPLVANGQALITTPIGAHFRMLNADNERVWSVTIRDEHAEDEVIIVDTSQHVAAPALDPRSHGAIRAVVQCLGAIVANPTQPKVRSLPLTNPVVSERMLPVKGVRELLAAVGFIDEVIEGKRCLHLPETHVDLGRLAGVLVTLRSALSTNTQHPHPVNFIVSFSDDADTVGGASLKLSASPSLSGQRASSGDGEGNAAWYNAATRADIVRRHVVEARGGLQLMEQAGGFKRGTAATTATSAAAGGGGSGSGDGGEGMSLCLEVTDLHRGLTLLDELDEALAHALPVSASRLQFGIDSEAFGQIQFTQQKCGANDWDFARTYANGDGCWEFGCGRQGGEETAVLMENARTRFSQLLKKDFRGAMTKRVPVTCAACQAALVVTQYQIESTKGRMLDISCPQCGTPVPLTAPTLHEEIQEALNREAGHDSLGRSHSGAGARDALGTTSSGGSITARSSGESASSGYVLGRPGSAHEGEGHESEANSMSTISIITLDRGSSNLSASSRNSSGASGSGGYSGNQSRTSSSSSSSREPRLDPELEPSRGGPVPVDDVEEGDVFLIQLPKREMTEAENFVRRQFERGDGAGDRNGDGDGDGDGTNEFDEALEKLRRDAKQSGDGSAMLTGRLLEIADSEPQTANPDAGAGLSRNLSVGRVPTGGPLVAQEVSSGDGVTNGRLVAELCDDSYGFTREAVIRALQKSSGDLFGALDLLEA